MLDRLRAEVNAAETSFGPEDHRTLTALTRIEREHTEELDRREQAAVEWHLESQWRD